MSRFNKNWILITVDFKRATIYYGTQNILSIKYLTSAIHYQILSLAGARDCMRTVPCIYHVETFWFLNIYSNIYIL